MWRQVVPIPILLGGFLAACSPMAPSAEPAPDAGAEALAFVGARIVDGTGAEPIADGVLVVRGGRIEAVGPADRVAVPDGAERIDLAGRTIIPGLVNAHGHVGHTRGLESGHYSRDNVVAQLALYARYGVTAVASLGGDREESVAVREAEDEALERARLRLAGPVVAAETAEEARRQVDAAVELGADFIKIRVDDNLGTTDKMAPEVFSAVIDQARSQSTPVFAHLYYLEDAKALLRAGVDLLAHSVRDQPVDEELLDLLRQRGVCYCPTLMREVSTFVYESEPEFFADPVFLREADPEVLEALRDAERQAQVRESAAAQTYKTALETAIENLGAIARAGLPVAFGTDTGPPGRFQGYFEHLELELMARSGLSPMEILVAATGAAAECLGLDDVGTLETGKWADLVVLAEDPLLDIRNTRSLESVWIAGNRVPPRPAS